MTIGEDYALDEHVCPENLMTVEHRFPTEKARKKGIILAPPPLPTPLKRTQRALAFVMKHHDLLLRRCQSQVILAQKEIGA